MENERIRQLTDEEIERLMKILMDEHMHPFAHEVAYTRLLNSGLSEIEIIQSGLERNNQWM
jgi:hypothetical protein